MDEGNKDIVTCREYKIQSFFSEKYPERNTTEGEVGT